VLVVRRRRKSEQAQQLMLWKIDWEDIDFLSSSADSNLTKSTVRLVAVASLDGLDVLSAGSRADQ